MLNYRILVMTSDKYLPAIPVFAHLLNKYWKPTPEVIVSGFKSPDFPLPDNFSFISVGKQEDFPFDRWSDALYLTLEEFRDDVFVLMLEDYWLTRPVNTDAVRHIADYMRIHPNILRTELSHDRLYGSLMTQGFDPASNSWLRYDTYEYLDFLRSNPENGYHNSLWPSMWNSDNLLKIMIPNESPHKFELIGTPRLRDEHPEMVVVGTYQNPLEITLGLRARDHSSVKTDGLKREDYEELRLAGLLSPWGIK